jgi:superfamily I DNA/RNA helicase
MEQWEAIRKLAREKRREMLPIANSDSAPTLISAAEQSTGIKCRPVASNDPNLSGSEAVLDPEAQTIWYSSALDKDLIPLYQAHEFAHHWIDGAHASCASTDISIELGEERTSTGLEKVESYGPKERRELQANVFAKEFLLPTDSLRIWFINEKLDASEIATKVELPLPVVFHQLTYALLTPQVSEPAAEKSIKTPLGRPGLDSSQSKSASFPHGPVLVKAGPGTGKTSTLVGRVIHLIKEKNVDPASILVLTFSNKAAEEMRERVVKELPTEAPHIWMGTFHSFGLELLRKFGLRIGLTSTPNVLDPVAALYLLEQSLASMKLNYYLNLYEPSLALHDILGAISRAKDELVDAPRYSLLAQQMRVKAVSDEEVMAAEKAIEVAYVYDFYQNKLGSEQKLDFGDLIFKSVLLLQQHADVCDSVRNTYKHILVDEYQDVNRACALLLKELAGNGAGLWVVGDARQSIYRFRGAAPQNMREFAQDFPGAEVISLEINYRSQPKVLAAFGALAPHMRATKGEDFTPWKNNRPDEGGHVLMEIADNLEAEGIGIAQEIKRQQRNGIPYREQAVLCRTHTTLGRLASILEKEDIPVLYLGDLFERSEIRDLLALTSLVCGDSLGLLRVATFPEYDIPTSDTYSFLQYSSEHEIPLPESIPLFIEQSEISEKGKIGFNLLEHHLQGLYYGTSAWSFLINYLFIRSRYLQPFLADLSLMSQQKKLAIYQFLRFANEQSQIQSNSADSKRKFLDYIRRLETFGEEKQLRQVPESAKNLDAVRFLTIHASKGLEFSAVYLPGLGQGYFPIKRQGKKCPPPVGMIPNSDGNEHDEEEECLFFVALSRAKDVLCLSRARKYGASNSNPSTILSLISQALPRPSDGTTTWNTAQISKTTSLTIIQPPSELPEFDVEALDLYLRCPLRYFYENIVNINGKSDDSAYLLFHRCLYAIMAWIATEQRRSSSLDENALLTQLDNIWAKQGPVGYPFETVYKVHAEAILINAFRGELLTNSLTEDEQLKVDIPAGRVRFNPDQIERLNDGTEILRRTRTGRISKSEKDKNIYALYQSVAESQHDAKSSVEILSLSTGDRELVSFSPKVMKTRLDKYNDAIRGIMGKQFSPTPTDRDCPRCPYYFVCMSTDKA